MTAIRTRVIKIGNSRGVRIPKTLLEQAGFADEVEILLDEGQLILRRVAAARTGWDEAFRRMALVADDRLLDPGAGTEWDEAEWEWA